MARTAARGWDRVTNMRHSVGASGAAGFLAAAAVVAGGLLLAAGAYAPAFAYSGSQAEAQSDPVADPYGFPNIKLCCEHKKKKYRKKPRHDDYGDYPEVEYDDGDRRTVRVSCGEPRRHSFSSIEEALEKLGVPFIDLNDDRCTTMMTNWRSVPANERLWQGDIGN